MLIAILSDSHDNTENIKKAIAVVKERGISRAIHLGDFTSPASLLPLAQSEIQWTCVWGNMDIDKEVAYELIKPFGNVDIAEEDFRQVTMEGKKLLLTHYPTIARTAALSGKYDAAFHGHTHMAAQEVIRNGRETLLANPGEICGYRFGKPSFGLYETATNTIEHMWL